MRAVVLHEYGGPEKLKFEDNVPDPHVSGGTVLIAAAAASVNPIDWKQRSGMRQKDLPLSFPAILGRDVSGVVRAVGANVKHFKPGDRVLALSKATYAELVAVDDSDVAHLPDGVDLANAAAIPLISLTGDQLVRLATNVKKGQVVLITGALGSVGRAAVHTAKKIGAQVIAGVRGKDLDDARSLGVSDVLAIDDDKAIEKFRLVDAIADTVGGDLAAKLIGKVKQNGSCLFHFAGGRTHGGGLLGLGVNADQRHAAHCAAAEGNHVTASPQVGLQFFRQVVGDRQAAQGGTVLAEGTDEMRGGEA
jgi:NADPH:quinone reductase-like Zn-dependent oxidoreductase